MSSAQVYLTHHRLSASSCPDLLCYRIRGILEASCSCLYCTFLSVRESGFQHHHQELYPPPPPRPSYPERQYSCTSLQGPGNSRGHGPAQAGHHHPEKSQPLCEPAPLSGASASPSPAPPACSQPAPDHPSSAASKQPIVYPWMKKIHVSTGRQLCFLLSPSPLPRRSPPSSAPAGPVLLSLLPPLSPGATLG